MNNLKLIVVALLVVTTFCKEHDHPIKNVVVLMMENRSYDHILGWMMQGGEYGNPKVNGLTGNECNYRDPQFPWKGKVCIRPNAPDNSQYNPNHSTESTTGRVFGCLYNETNSSDPKVANNPCLNHASISGNATMGGFVMSAIKSGHDGTTEMSTQLPLNVPIITTLANQFTQFDNYFASYPGPTNPNRLFVHAGTCDGCVGNEQTTGQFKNKTIQEVLDNHNLSWRYYYEGDAEGWFLYIDYFNQNFNEQKFPPMEQFYVDAANGNLANYTFINPSDIVHPEFNNTKSFGLPNDQHPDNSIREGERLIKNVYEALRNGPLWNQTLFVLTYDEHGGFYDHVSPPQEGVPNPDGKMNELGFNFTRLGMRVPLILISPWIEKNIVVKHPASHQKPFPTSQFEHTSIISSVLSIFGIDEHLSKRTEWAATFDDLLRLRKEPRTDCPIELPYVPPPTPADIERLYQSPIKDRHKKKVKSICTKLRPHDKECGVTVHTFSDLVKFIKREMEFLSLTA